MSGAAVFQLVPELDAGDVFGQITQPIGRHQTAGTLLEALAKAGAVLLAQVVDGLADGSARAEPQQGEITLAPKLTLEDGRVDWALPAASIANRVRGVTPEPGAFTTLDGARLKVLEAIVAHGEPRLDPGKLALLGKRVLVGTASDPIELVTVHPAGKRAMPAADWWRGRPANAGTHAE